MQGNNSVQPMRRRQQREQPMAYTPTPDYQAEYWNSLLTTRRRHLTVAGPACDCNTEPCFIRGFCESCDR